MKAKTAQAKVIAKVKAKPASKPAKVKAKPASKPAKVKAKRAASTAPKSVKAKAVLKPAAKPAKTKAPVSSVAKKPSAKAAATPKKIKVPVKSTPQAGRAAAKPGVKPGVNKAGPAATGKPASASKKQISPVPETPKASITRPAVAAPSRPAPKSTAAPVPPKPVRLSRLQQLTVPSMAQSIASTAAKSSYAQLPDRIVPIPPVFVAAKKDSKLAHNWKRKALDQLTDADLLAMPDAEYMNAVQTAFFRSKLVKLKNDMLDNAGETTEHLREETVIVPDPADRATIEEEHALELRTRDRERKLLKKIAQSIVRIDAGDYGYCDETGEPIGVARLLARPTATLSLEAQQRRELKQKMFGD